MNAKRDISNTPLWLSIKDNVPEERHEELKLRLIRAVRDYHLSYTPSSYLVIVRGLKRDLISAFSFDSTVEGYNYWAEVYCYTRDGGTFPEHPQTMPSEVRVNEQNTKET